MPGSTIVAGELNVGLTGGTTYIAQVGTIPAFAVIKSCQLTASAVVDSQTEATETIPYDWASTYILAGLGVDTTANGAPYAISVFNIGSTVLAVTALNDNVLGTTVIDDQLQSATNMNYQLYGQCHWEGDFTATAADVLWVSVFPTFGDANYAVNSCAFNWFASVRYWEPPS